MAEYTQGLCSAIQVNLNDIAGSNAPALRRERVGMVDAIMSDVNRASFTAQIVPTNGKFRTVQVNWQQQICDTDVSSSCAVNCTPSVEPSPKEQLLSIDNCISIKMGFDENEMRKLCEADSVWVGQTIMNAMNGLNVKLDKALLTTYEANYGEFVLDSTTGNVTTPLFNTNGQVNPMSAAYIKHVYEQTGLAGVPIVVGGGSLDLWMKANQIACCNSAYGMDMSRFTGEMYYYADRFANSVLGTNSNAIWSPGSTQLVLWNKYVGDYAKKNDSFEHGTVVDPFTGLVYDLKTNYDDCAEKWFVELSLHYHHWFMPFGGCAGGGDVNGTAKLVDCSAGADISCPQS